MSGPQFVHIETYARSVSSLRREREVARAEKGQAVDRKLTVEEICGEAARLPGHHPHVDDPKAPVLLYGISPDKVPALLEERIEEANAKIRAMKAAMERGTRKDGPKAVRSDTHTLLTIVASYPIPWRDEKTGEALFDRPENRALLEKWQRLNVKWAKKKAKQLGFELVSVVRHDDEGHPHLHFIGIPSNLRVDARACHPGYTARAAVQQDGTENDKQFRARRDRYYKAAMRSFQDDYFVSVSIDAGLVRTGPKRRRVPGAVWHEEKAAARARGLAAVRADQLAEECEQTQQELEQSKEMLTTTTQQAVEAIIMASDLEGDVKRKTAHVLSLNDQLREGDRLLANFEVEQEALQKAKDERAQLEAENDRIRAGLMRDAAELRLQTEEFSEQRRKFVEDKKRKDDELAEQRRAVEGAQKELDALNEGVLAYAEGKLRYNPENASQPFVVVIKRDGSEDDLKARLQAVKPRLIPIIERLDRAMSERATQVQRALTKAVAAWSTGLLQGMGEDRADGRPTFLIPETPKGDSLLKAIEPFRELVAQVISALPDRGVIAFVKSALSRLQPRLAQAEQEEAREFQRNLEYLNQQIDGGRG